MRHRVAHRKLGRVTEHRIAMLRNQAHDLLLHERIRTTVPRAKELRPFVERIITIAKRGIVSGENGRALHARRLVLRDIPDRDVVHKLFESLAPRFAERPGGYTRILRLGVRRGDAADLAQIELVGSEYDPAAEKAEKEAAGGKTKPAPKKKGVGGRLRAAASRWRGKRTDEEGARPEKAARARGTGAAKRAGAKKAATRSKKGS